MTLDPTGANVAVNATVVIGLCAPSSRSMHSGEPGEPGEALGVARRWAALPVVAPASSASIQPRYPDPFSPA